MYEVAMSGEGSEKVSEVEAMSEAEAMSKAEAIEDEWRSLHGRG